MIKPPHTDETGCGTAGAGVLALIILTLATMIENSPAVKYMTIITSAILVIYLIGCLVVFLDNLSDETSKKR